MRRYSSIFIVGVLIVLASVALNVLQAKRIIELQRGSTSSGTGAELSVGSHLSEINARDLRGSDLKLSFNSKVQKPKVLYIFSPSCVWCQRNAENVNSLVAQTQDRYDFIALSLSTEGVAKFVSDHQSKFPVYQNLSAETIGAYRVASTPETFVISTDGTVLATWQGAYTGATKLDMEKFFAARLPDSGS